MIIEYEGQRHQFPDDFTEAEIAAALNSLSAPAKEASLGEAAKQHWENPPAISLTNMLLKPAAALMKAPGEAMQGKFSPPPVTPGMLTEEDIFRQDTARAAEADIAAKGAPAVILGGAPGGIFGAPRGALGMGFTRPGTIPSGAPVKPPAGAAPASTPQQVVEAATRVDVPVPRYMVSESRLDQGLAAGLQNIPGAGDKIAKAADVTQKALGTATENVTKGFGTGSPAVAGSSAKDALADWVTTGSDKVANRVYDAVDNLINPSVTTELKATAQAAQTILARRDVSAIPGRSAAVDTVMDAVTRPGGLPYEGIKGLRTFLGEMTPQEIISQGLKGSEVKQLYGALTQDLRTSVLNAGGAPALTAFNRANTIFEQIATRREALSKILGAKNDAAPEAVFARILAMAGSKSNADASRLLQARKAMGPEAWNEVASAVVGRLGRDPTGEFSIKRFLGPNGWGGLAPAGRQALFRSTGKDDLARALDDIAFVTKEIEEKLLQFYNPSGTGKSIASTGTVLGVLHSPLKTLSTIIGGNRLAQVLSEPATARATADWAKTYRDAIIAPHKAGAARKAAERLAGLIVGGNKAEAQALAERLIIGGGFAPSGTLQ